MYYIYSWRPPKQLRLSLLVVCFFALVLETEKEYIEAAKRNDVETMKLLGRAVNVNAKNVVRQ